MESALNDDDDDIGWESIDLGDSNDMDDFDINSIDSILDSDIDEDELERTRVKASQILELDDDEWYESRKIEREQKKKNMMEQVKYDAELKRSLARAKELGQALENIDSDYIPEEYDEDELNLDDFDDSLDDDWEQSVEFDDDYELEDNEEDNADIATDWDEDQENDEIEAIIEDDFEEEEYDEPDDDFDDEYDDDGDEPDDDWESELDGWDEEEEEPETIKPVNNQPKSVQASRQVQNKVDEQIKSTEQPQAYNKDAELEKMRLEMEIERLRLENESKKLEMERLAFEKEKAELEVAKLKAKQELQRRKMQEARVRQTNKGLDGNNKTVKPRNISADAVKERQSTSTTKQIQGQRPDSNNQVRGTNQIQQRQGNGQKQMRPVGQTTHKEVNQQNKVNKAGTNKANEHKLTKEQYYSTLDARALYDEVKKFLMDRDVAQTAIHKSVVDDEFGAKNVDRLIKLSYLILMGGNRITIGIR